MTASTKLPSTKLRVIVTGGAGFIGSHIVNRYCHSGYEVAVIDNLSTGKKANLDRRAQFFKDDILDRSAIEKIFKKIKPTIVNHHAAQASVAQSVKDPGHDAAVNILGTLNIAQAASRVGAKKIIFASTVAVYGNSQNLPLTEDSAKAPTTAYGLSKLTAEQYLKLYWQQAKIPYLILRYANVYGPRQSADAEGGVVAIFINQSLKNQPTTIFGHGRQTRDFVYVGDVAWINQAVMALKGPQIINVGTGHKTSILDLHRLIAQLLGSKQKPHFVPKRPGDIMDSWVSPDTIKKVLPDYRPTALKQGIITTIEKWQNQPK